jgi:Holliday junction resolvase-like predicted endonuclease
MVSDGKSFKEKAASSSFLTVSRQIAQSYSPNIEREMIMTILKLTQQGAVSYELIKKEANLHSLIAEKLLRKMQSTGLIDLRENGLVEVDSVQRLRLAVCALQTGADPESLTSLLRWDEFEDFAVFALEQSDWSVERNVRFKHNGHRWEIDVVGCRKPIVLCIDCKHWQHRITPSVLREVVAKQVQRTRELADALPHPSIKIQCANWQKAIFVPAVISLRESKLKFEGKVPVVPVLMLQDFLNGLLTQVNELEHVEMNVYGIRL